MTQPPRPPHPGRPADPDTARETEAAPDPGAVLRGLRLASGQDPAAFAAALGLSADRLHALERGEAALPSTLLPRLAEVLDAPLETLVAELYGVPHRAAEMEALARAYAAIPTPAHREAVLALALALSAEGEAG